METVSTPSDDAKWIIDYLDALKRDGDRKIFLDLVDRAQKLTHSKDFFNLLLCMVLSQHDAIEKLLSGSHFDPADENGQEDPQRLICARCLTEHNETSYRPEFHLFLCVRCNEARIAIREIVFGRKPMATYKQYEL